MRLSDPMLSLATQLVLTQTESPAPVPPVTGGGATGLNLAALVAPILSTGLVGVLFLMVLFRIKVMPTYVYDNAEKAWNDERTRLTEAWNGERDRFRSDVAELKIALKDANSVYTQQVIPTLTRVLDSERELVELRRDEAVERRRRDP